MTRLRALIVCPGRGSYGRAQLASLPPGDPIVGALDRFRARLGRPAISGLDRAAEYTPRLHVAGEHASLLTFACSAVDLAAPAPWQAPGVDDKTMLGLLAFLAQHDSYHVGQMAILRKAVGLQAMSYN